MKLTVDRDPLLVAMGKVFGSLPKKTTIPILEMVLLQTGDDELAVRATDLDMAALAYANATIDRPGEACVPASTLHDILKTAPLGAELGLTLDDDGNRLTVQCGRSRFRLPVLPPHDYPKWDDASDQGEVALSGVSAKALMRLIDKTSFAMASDTKRGSLHALYLHREPTDDGPRLRAAGTDGKKLAFADLALEGLPDDWPGAIVPPRTVSEIRRWLVDVTGEVALATDGRRVRLLVGGARLTSKLLDASTAYPDYRRFLQPVQHTAGVDVGLFRGAVKRVALVAKDDLRTVKIKLTAGTATLTARSLEAGEADEVVEAEYDGPELNLTFHGGQLSEMLGQIEAARMELDMGGPGIDRVTFRDPDAPDVLLMNALLKI
jgi:DNA polymerase III subunit beta